MNAIFHRKSTRVFLAQEVPKEKIEWLLRAAMQAPSACNQQPWEFYVVRDRKVLEMLSHCSPYAACVQKAPLAIVLCFRRGLEHGSYVLLDMSAAAENLLLEAEVLGLGAVWLGIAPAAERMDAVRRCLSLPDAVEAFAVIPCGYPAEQRQPEDRFDRSRVHEL